MRAVDIMDAIRRKKLSAREVMQAHLKQIKRVNPKVNAIVTLVPEDQFMAQAAAADEALAHGKWLGPLHGLPVAVKDLHETNGIRTTFGSPLHKNYRAGLRLPGRAAGERGGSDRNWQDKRA